MFFVKSMQPQQLRGFPFGNALVNRNRAMTILGLSSPQPIECLTRMPDSLLEKLLWFQFADGQ